MACRRRGRAVDLERLRCVFGLAPAAERAPPRPARPPTPPAPAAALTPGQVALAGDAHCRGAGPLRALPERSRARFLGWHRAGVNPDPILAGEVARVLRPQSRSAPGSSPGEPLALAGEPARPRPSPDR